MALLFNKSIVKNTLQYLNLRLFYIWLLFFSFLSVAISPEISAPYAVASTYIFYYLLYLINNTIFKISLYFLTISLVIYYPISMLYGTINSGIIAAFLETNFSEAASFLGGFSVDMFILPFLYILSLIILIRLLKYNIKPTIKSQKILFIILIVVFLFTLLYSPSVIYFKNNYDWEEKTWKLSNTPINIISFYSEMYNSFESYYTEKKLLENAKDIMVDWNILSTSSQYKNYVLVIGESARKDYFSTYGFPLQTTPFLDKTNGYINQGYISAAPGTYHSLLGSLYFKEKEKKIDYAYNIITLAKAAKIETIWLSNQGAIGKYDTIASRIGASADKQYFIKKAGYNTSGETDDLELLPLFQNELKKENPTDKARLFVLHLMGSHQKFCSRLNEEEKKIIFINENLSCYASSILKTDAIIEKIIAQLQQQNEPYSLIYFSHHGLSHINKDDQEKVTLDYSGKFKQNYAVPFFKLSSDDSDRTVVNTQRSAMNFIYGFAQWLGIKSQRLGQSYDFFSEKNDNAIKVYNFEQMLPFNSLESDPIPYYLTK